MNFRREYYSYQPSPAPLLPARALQLPKQQSPELIKQLGLRQASAHHQFIPVKRYWASATPIHLRIVRGYSCPATAELSDDGELMFHTASGVYYLYRKCLLTLALREHRINPMIPYIPCDHGPHKKPQPPRALTPFRLCVALPWLRLLLLQAPKFCSCIL